MLLPQSPRVSQWVLHMKWVACCTVEDSALRKPGSFKALLANLPHFGPWRDTGNHYYPGHETNLASTLGGRHLLCLLSLSVHPHNCKCIRTSHHAPAQKTGWMGGTRQNFLLSISYFWIFFFKEWMCFSLSLQGNEGWGIPIPDTKAESHLAPCQKPTEDEHISFPPGQCNMTGIFWERLLSSWEI